MKLCIGGFLIIISTYIFIILRLIPVLSVIILNCNYLSLTRMMRKKKRSWKFNTRYIGKNLSSQEFPKKITNKSKSDDTYYVMICDLEKTLPFTILTTSMAYYKQITYVYPWMSRDEQQLCGHVRLGWDYSFSWLTRDFVMLNF